MNTNRRPLPAVIVLSQQWDVLFLNDEAAALLAALNADPSGAISSMPEDILASLSSQTGLTGAPIRTELGGNPYLLRCLPLSCATRNSAYLLLMIEDASVETACKVERFGKDFGLTKREVDVIGCMVKGCTNKKVAETLGLTENTVKSYIKSLMRKLGGNSRSEVISMVFNARGGGGEDGEPGAR